MVKAGMGTWNQPPADINSSRTPADAKVWRLHELFSFASTHNSNCTDISNSRHSKSGTGAKGSNDALVDGQSSAQQQQQQQQKLCTKALSVIAGSSLHVLVVPDSGTAKQLLERPGAFLGSTSSSQVSINNCVMMMSPCYLQIDMCFAPFLPASTACSHVDLE